MKHLSSHTLHFTSLAPINMGCDDTFEPTNYVIDDDTLYGFSDSALQDVSAGARQQLLEIVSRPNSSDMLSQVQSFFYNNRGTFAAVSQHMSSVCEGVQEHYTSRIGSVTQHKRTGGKEINKLGIERTAHDHVTGNPYLPGTGIKGAIRTALLDAFNGGQSSEYREKARDVQKRLLEGAFHTDPLRLLSIADAHWEDKNQPAITDIQFAVNRRRAAAEGKPSMAQEKGLYQMLECLKPFQPCAFKATMQIQHPSKVIGKHKDLPLEKKQFTTAEIALACNRFFGKQFKDELSALQKFRYLDEDWKKSIDQLFAAGVADRLNNNRSFLLRIGRHSGAEALTLEGMRSIKIMAGKGNRPKYESKPTTWWLQSQSVAANHHMRPYGWILVDIDLSHDDIEARKKHQAPQREQEQHWLAERQSQQQLRRDELLEKRRVAVEQAEQLAAKRRERELKEKIAAEKIAEQQAIRETQLNKLNPLEREVEEFPTTLDAIKALENSHWSDTADAANYIKQRMQRDNEWREVSSKKNSNKDKPFLRTQTVKQYLS